MYPKTYPAIYQVFFCGVFVLVGLASNACGQRPLFSSALDKVLNLSDDRPGFVKSLGQRSSATMILTKRQETLRFSRFSIDDSLKFTSNT